MSKLYKMNWNCSAWTWQEDGPVGSNLCVRLCSCVWNFPASLLPAQPHMHWCALLVCLCCFCSEGRCWKVASCPLFRKHALNCHRMKPALFNVLCEIKEKTGKFSPCSAVSLLLCVFSPLAPPADFLFFIYSCCHRIDLFRSHPFSKHNPADLNTQLVCKAS